MTPPVQLGDSHNFGRRVTLGARRVRKPRAVLWEWLVLGADSPLRKLLDEASERDGLGPGAFGFLPALEFVRPEARDGGEVERVSLAPLPARLSRADRGSLAQIVGRSLALFTWLGVSDLHWENLVLGLANDRIVFAPLDIEMILADLSLPTETKLLPDADPEYAEICRHAAGARRVLPYLGKPIAVEDLISMVSAYARTLAFLERQARAVADVLARLPGLRETPIRVCLRSTGDYVSAGAGAPLWPPLLDGEAEQLARGDIPYFFRLYGRAGIHYYAEKTLRDRKTLPLHGDVPQLDPMLPLARGLRSRTRKKLREEGLFTVLGAFDHPSFAGTHAAGEVEVTFKARSLRVKLASGGELESRRDLSAFVGSVYLPCRCGEVRTAFVPPVTVCEADL